MVMGRPVTGTVRSVMSKVIRPGLFSPTTVTSDPLDRLLPPLPLRANE